MSQSQVISMKLQRSAQERRRGNSQTQSRYGDKGQTRTAKTAHRVINPSHQNQHAQHVSPKRTESVPEQKDRVREHHEKHKGRLRVAKAYVEQNKILKERLKEIYEQLYAMKNAQQRELTSPQN
ncbi:hypothetical protein GCK32_009264, partial [Trichostrongylus colubriformis]